MASGLGCGIGLAASKALAAETSLFARSMRVPLGAGDGPGSAVLDDMNRDGKLDLIVANERSGTLTLLLNRGNGELQPQSFPAGKSPNDLALGDFNGDGHPDVAIANHDSDYVSLLLGDGTGRLSPAPSSPFRVRSDPHPHGVAAGDFDGDGALDVVIESWAEDRVTVLFGTGRGAFETPGASWAVGDHPYHRLRSSDLNADGRPDIITSNFGSGDITVLLAGRGRSFTEAPGSPFPVGPRPFGVAPGDVSGDGLIDLATVHYSGSASDPSDDAVVVLLADGRGGFGRAPGSPFSTGGAPVSIAGGDVDGDGLMDIAVVSLVGESASLILGGRDELRVPRESPLPVGRGPEGVALGDLDGDRKADLVSCNTASDDLTLYLTRKE